MTQPPHLAASHQLNVKAQVGQLIVGAEEKCEIRRDLSALSERSNGMRDDNTQKEKSTNTNTSYSAPADQITRRPRGNWWKALSAATCCCCCERLCLSGVAN